jgi:hypothetical protein
MSDISNFARWKDWLLLTLCGLVFGLISVVASENRDRIVGIEVELARTREIRQQGFERLRALESSIGTGPAFTRQDAREMEARLERQIDNLERRLEEIRRKLNGGGS